MEALIPVAIVGVLVASLVSHFFFNHDARIKRALKNVKRRPIREVRDGMVAKVCGKLSHVAPPLEGPLTGRACAYYLVIVEQYKSYGRGGSWVQLVREEKSQDFLLHDDSGRALVRMAAAKVAVVKDANFRSGTLKDATPGFEAFLARHGHTSKGWVFNKKLRYSEGVLEAGEDIAVGGVGRWEPDPDPGAQGGAYREAPMRLVFHGSDKLPLLISDDTSTVR